MEDSTPTFSPFVGVFCRQGLSKNFKDIAPRVSGEGQRGRFQGSSRSRNICYCLIYGLQCDYLGLLGAATAFLTPEDSSCFNISPWIPSLRPLFSFSSKNIYGLI